METITQSNIKIKHCFSKNARKTVPFFSFSILQIPRTATQTISSWVARIAGMP